jgi:hypothetical protein
VIDPEVQASIARFLDSVSAMATDDPAYPELLAAQRAFLAWLAAPSPATERAANAALAALRAHDVRDKA